MADTLADRYTTDPRKKRRKYSGFQGKKTRNPPEEMSDRWDTYVGSAHRSDRVNPANTRYNIFSKEAAKNALLETKADKLKQNRTRPK